MSDPVLRAAIALYDRFTHEGMDRRAFMAELTRIAGGSAAAAMLLSSVACRAAAAQVPPDAPGIQGQEVEWEVAPGRALRGYQAMPEGAAQAANPVPAVVVIHENRGLNDHIRDVARRLAVAGYQAVAPDFLSGAGGTPADEDRAREMIGQLDMARTIADGTETVRRLGVLQERQRKVGIVGFCWGGAMVHRVALAAGDSLAAAVSFYGPAPDPAEASRLVAPELVILAGRDTRVNATAGPWVAALRAAGKDVTEITYPDVDHAFHNDTSAARYNRAAAEQAWAATLDFFRRHLGA
ncbi:dienelactone hydrolase family protein [Sphingosinicella sp. LHD-64]|uniref:dienelactone hydrolase family protein n=1 Tax=Sphingosinicella sp. LHD-64 TaxID=3072139 RepID=UPI00280EA4F6|nr:dienelactone hydrolase family protein [Sphingosinicella sp. LHD-64]MDQ8757867.1 dienelactone hydrolase family protein [Sphingosinicella sp. LHD-64]